MKLNHALKATRATGVAAALLAAALALPAPARADVSGPTDLQVADVTATSFTLEWSEPSDTRGLYGYSVRDLDNPFVNNQIGWSFSTSATIDADPETTYTVAVRTRYINHPDGAVESQPSNAVTVTTLADTEPPETPDALRLLGRTATSVSFRRSLANDNVGTWAPDYLIEVNGGERFVPVNRSQWSWGVQGLATNATHSFRVKAIDAAGNESEWSDPVSVAIENQPPTAPANIRVEGDLAVWDASTDNSGSVRYEVFIDGEHISSPRQPRDDFSFWEEVAEAFGPGAHEITIEAVDSSENRSEASEPFVIVAG